jgi:ABC-type dipeptide/oligopeptide/nickel transport system ATPase subunit
LVVSRLYVTSSAFRASKSPGRAAGRARIDGDPHLAAAALQIVSIIWRDPSSSLNPRPQPSVWREQLTISLGNQ